MIYVALFLLSDMISREKESITARALLSDFYKKIFGCAHPEIKKSELGKPYFDFPNSHPFSISHSKGAVAVAVSDEACNIGIDVQKEVGKEKATRIFARFPFVKKRSFKEEPDIRIFKATLFDSTFLFEELKPAPCRESDFTLLWTNTEAALKSDGGGFASAKKLDEIEKSCSIFSFKEGEFYISIAKT